MINGAKVRAPAAALALQERPSLSLPPSRRMRTDQQPVRISLFAPNGRMGQAIAAAIAEDPGFAIDQDHGDVLVDFSAPAALQASLDRAVVRRRSDPDRNDRARRASPAARSPTAAKEIAVLRAPNTSLGVALLADLVERAARVLGPEWDIEIVETHHRIKADAPSGTALMLGEAAARGRGSDARRPSAGATAPASSASRARSASPRSAAAPSPATMT